MFISSFDIVFKEVPGEISLCYSVCGCPLKCKGCHSPHLFKEENGTKLKQEEYIKKLIDYRGYATCVLFMGGEWEPKLLVSFLEIAKALGYKTCLYTGLNKVDDVIIKQLDFIKTGDWKQELGGLESENTNQIFKEVATGRILNSFFQKK